MSTIINCFVIVNSINDIVFFVSCIVVFKKYLMAEEWIDDFGVKFSKKGNDIILENAPKSIINYIVPNNVTIVAKGAFKECFELQNIVLPRSLTTIESEAFYGCVNVKKIDLPATVNLQKDAFYGCEDVVRLVQQGNRFLIVDTETTGLENPRMVQISWILCRQYMDVFEIESQHDYIVYPDGFDIPEESVKIHGITTQYAKENGIDRNIILEKFADDVEKCNYIVGHNIDFDKSVLYKEFPLNYRYSSDFGDFTSISFIENFLLKKTICTMLSGARYNLGRGCLNKKGQSKFLKLTELYKELFGENFIGCHNSRNDVEITFQCFKELLSRNIIDLSQAYRGVLNRKYFPESIVLCKFKLDYEVLKMVAEAYFYDQNGDLRFRINLNNGTHISGYCDWTIEGTFGPDETFEPRFYYLEKVLSENDRFYYMLCGTK